MKKLFHHAMMFVILAFVHIDTATAQSLRDSILTITKYFYDSTNHEALKKTLTEAQALYKNDSVSEALATRLVAAENLILKLPLTDQKMVLSYAEMLEHSLRYLPRNEESLNYAYSLHNLAKIYSYKGIFAMALPLFQRALEIRKRTLGEEHPDYASTLDNLAILYHRMGEFDKGLSMCEKALAIRKKVLGEDHPDYASSLTTRSLFYVNAGEFQKGVTVVQQALSINKKISGEEDPDYAASLSNLATLFDEMGEYEKAITTFQQVVAIKKKILGEEHPGYAMGLSGLAMEYAQTGAYEKALPLSQQALAITKKTLGVDHPEFYLNLIHLARIYLLLGQLHIAMPIYQEALMLSKKIYGEEHPKYGYSLHNLAIVYMELGEYDKALQLYQRSLAIIKKGAIEENEYSNALFNIALLYEKIGDYGKGLAFQTEVLSIHKKILGEEHVEYAMDLNFMAYLYTEMGDYIKALPLFEQALAITKKVQGEEHPDYATILESLAELYVRLKQYDKALQLYKQSLTIKKKVLGEKHFYNVNILNGLAEIYGLSGNTTAASSSIQEACIIELEYLVNTYSTLTEQEKMKLLSKESYQFSYLPSLMFVKGVSYSAMLQQLYTNELALKGMVLEDQANVLRGVRKSGDSSALVLYEQWQLNKNLLGRQYLLPLNGRNNKIDSLEEASNQLEQQLSRRFTVFRNGLQRITQKDISHKLLKGQAAIEFLQFKLYNKKWTDSTLYAALILLPDDTTVHFVQLFEEKQLQGLLSPFLKKVNNYALIEKLYPGKMVPGKLQDSLYLLIWKPLEKYLKNIHTVYYAPAGLLHRIPFNALRSDNNCLLIDKYTLHQLLSTRSVALPAQTDSKPGSAGLWGNIQYSSQAGNIASRGMEADQQNSDTTAASFNFYAADSRGSRGGDWRALPGTKKEMDNIGTVLMNAGINITVDSGLVATEEAFKLLDGKSPRVLHLATHGFFLPVPVAMLKNNTSVPDDNAFTTQQNPMFRSGLILSGGNYAWKGGTALPGKEDGILTAYEIAQMDLSNTGLVVLSACETALGDIQGNEGVIGLQRAFKMAGVKQLIVSLWRIPDKETTELMTLFYNNWLHGQSTRDALRAAQLTMKAKYPPYYWAAFVLVD